MGDSLAFIRLVSNLIHIKNACFRGLLDGSLESSEVLSDFTRIRASLLSFFDQNHCRLTIPGTALSYVFSEPYLARTLHLDFRYLQKSLREDYSPTIYRSSTPHRNKVSEIVRSLSLHKPDLLVSDRDGTLVPQDGKFFNSLQSLSDACILHRLVQKIPCFVVSASPLLVQGLSERMLMAQGDSWLAGSNGAECLDNRTGHYHRFETNPNANEEQVLEITYRNMLQLYQDEPMYAVFQFVGFGLQKRVGKLMFAFQDRHFPVASSLSRLYRKKVMAVIRHSRADQLPDLQVVETDNALVLESNNAPGTKRTLSQPLKYFGITSSRRCVLVCGNDFADVDLVRLMKTQEAIVFSVFVTADVGLKQLVARLSDESFFLSSQEELMQVLDIFSNTYTH